MSSRVRLFRSYATARYTRFFTSSRAQLTFSARAKLRFLDSRGDVITKIAGREVVPALMKYEKEERSSPFLRTDIKLCHHLFVEDVLFNSLHPIRNVGKEVEAAYNNQTTGEREIGCFVLRSNKRGTSTCARLINRMRRMQILCFRVRWVRGDKDFFLC